MIGKALKMKTTSDLLTYNGSLFLYYSVKSPSIVKCVWAKYELLFVVSLYIAGVTVQQIQIQEH